MTIILTSVAKPDVTVMKESFALCIFLNIVVGALIGYMAQLILLAIDAGGDMVNMQWFLILRHLHRFPLSVNVFLFWD